MTYEGMTDANGDAQIILAQPRGVGLITPLSVVPIDSLLNSPISRSVKFTVPTSPDTPKAHMWGHMADAVTVDNLTFERPKLAAESGATRTRDEANETRARLTHADALGNTAAGDVRLIVCHVSTSLPLCTMPTMTARYIRLPDGLWGWTTGPSRTPASPAGNRYRCRVVR